MSKKTLLQAMEDGEDKAYYKSKKKPKKKKLQGRQAEYAPPEVKYKEKKKSILETMKDDELHRKPMDGMDRLRAGLEAAAAGATWGLSDVIIRNLPGDEPQHDVEERRARHSDQYPWESGLSAVAGGLAVPGGYGNVSKIASKLLFKGNKLTKLATGTIDSAKKVNELSKLSKFSEVGKTIGKIGVLSGSEAATYAATRKNATKESIGQSAVLGTILGPVIAGTFKGAGYLIKKISPQFAKTYVTEKRQKIIDWALKQQRDMGREGKFLNFVTRGNYENWSPAEQQAAAELVYLKGWGAHRTDKAIKLVQSEIDAPNFVDTLEKAHASRMGRPSYAGDALDESLEGYVGKSSSSGTTPEGAQIPGKPSGGVIKTQESQAAIREGQSQGMLQQIGDQTRKMVKAVGDKANPSIEHMTKLYKDSLEKILDELKKPEFMSQYEDVILPGESFLDAKKRLISESADRFLSRHSLDVAPPVPGSDSNRLLELYETRVHLSSQSKQNQLLRSGEGVSGKNAFKNNEEAAQLLAIREEISFVAGGIGGDAPAGSFFLRNIDGEADIAKGGTYKELIDKSNAYLGALKKLSNDINPENVPSGRVGNFFRERGTGNIVSPQAGNVMATIGMLKRAFSPTEAWERLKVVYSPSAFSHSRRGAEKEAIDLMSVKLPSNVSELFMFRQALMAKLGAHVAKVTPEKQAPLIIAIDKAASAHDEKAFEEVVIMLKGLIPEEFQPTDLPSEIIDAEGNLTITDPKVKQSLTKKIFTSDVSNSQKFGSLMALNKNGHPGKMA